MHTNIDTPRIVSICEDTLETPNVKTLIFQDNLSFKAKPGQFLMVWIPGVEELPMSVMVSNTNDNAAITVKKYGIGSTALFQKKKGDVIGIRGPYGNYFRVSKKQKKVILIGGGTGLVPLMRLSVILNKMQISCTLIIGARSKPEILFYNFAKKILQNTKHKIIVTTEDGSFGIKGYPTDALIKILEHDKFDMAYTCGPELMMKKVYDISISYDLSLQASLERYMKCGVGICASCCINDKLVCTDGTVFNNKELKMMTDFGLIYRNKSGIESHY